MINWSKDLPNIKPKYIAIMQLIKSLIQNDQLLPGQRLPSERSLANWFQMDRSTVTRAMSELTSQGLLFKKLGSGTFVSEQPQLKPLVVNINWQTLLNPVETTSSTTEDKLTQARILNQSDLIDGAVNELPSELIPRLGNITFDWQEHLDQHHSTTGNNKLIETLSLQQSLKQKIDLTQQTVMISGGAEQSLLLVLSSLLKAGDAIAFSTPSYFHSTAVFQTLGIHTYSVHLNHLNFNLSELKETILKHRIKLLILNPTFENPTGETLSLQQRKSILNLCQEYQVAIVEDDVFGWLINTDDSQPTLKSLSPANVIYISSLSKLLGSNIRIGWIIAPKAIGHRLLQVQKQLDMIPSMLAQEMVNKVLNSPEFDTGLTHLTQTLKNRREKVAEVFHELCPKWHFSIPSGGFYLWIIQDDSEIFNKLLERKILVKPGTIYGATKNEFRFNVSSMNPQRISELKKGLKKLD